MTEAAFSEARFRPGPPNAGRGVLFKSDHRVCIGAHICPALHSEGPGFSFEPSFAIRLAEAAFSRACLRPGPLRAGRGVQFPPTQRGRKLCPGLALQACSLGNPTRRAASLHLFSVHFGGMPSSPLAKLPPNYRFLRRVGARLAPPRRSEREQGNCLHR